MKLLRRMVLISLACGVAGVLLLLGVAVSTLSVVVCQQSLDNAFAS